MNQRISFQQMIPIMLVLMLLGVIGLVVLSNVDTSPAQFTFDVSGGQSGFSNPNTFDYERAAELSAERWGAMADFYREQGLLTRDNFDYERAAEISAMRWGAMAAFYSDNGMLIRDDFDYEAAADNSAYRWQAMASFYEKKGLLNK